MKTYTANYTNLKTGNSLTMNFSANSLKEAKVLAQNNKRHSRIGKNYSTSVFYKKSK